MPVFNQVEELPAVLQELRAQPLACDDFIIIDNGSSDGSERLIAESGFPFLRIPINRGIGYSYMVAVDWALKQGHDALGVLASNGKMLPSEMSRITEPLRRGEADYVSGSRFTAEGAYPNLPAFRRLTIPLVNFFIFCISGHRLTDATCGYRALLLKIIREAEFDWKAPWLDTYGMEYYLYAKVLFSGKYRCREVPITMRYPEKGKRYSKIRGIVDWYAMLKPWVWARIDGKWFR
jgi:glycosyltransferase involved in cell wall biosynthesis